MIYHVVSSLPCCAKTTACGHHGNFYDKVQAKTWLGAVKFWGTQRNDGYAIGMSSVCLEQLLHLVEVAEDLASDMLPASFLMVHDTRRGRQDNESEGTGGKHIGHPTLNLVERDTEARRHHTTLVDTAVQLHDNLASAVVIDDVEVADVA